MIRPLARNDELLTYIAIGDAYCMATEYIKSPRDDELKKEALKFERYLSHPSHGLKPGTYTDDTHMSIGNAEVLIEATHHTNIKHSDFASKWVEVYETPTLATSRCFWIGFQAGPRRRCALHSCKPD